jgi:hypothetical protein
MPLKTPLTFWPSHLMTLNESQTQFVVELIRSAEANHYTRAALANAEPYIKFDVHPGKIVVETNEDGFTAADVQAICQLGVSTETSTAKLSQIGRERHEFKSVFMASSKVYINSGPFSFFLEHQPGDSGLGMITPVYCEHEEILEEPLTRITLTLLDNLNREDLKNQLCDLSGTLLLFLEKLKIITINEYNETAKLSESVTYNRDSGNSGLRVTTLEKIFKLNGEPPKTDRRRYYITKKRLRNLPNDNRSHHNAAEVMLAFPLDIQDMPIIEKQDVYSYLPIRNLGFSVSLFVET